MTGTPLSSSTCSAATLAAGYPSAVRWSPYPGATVGWSSRTGPPKSGLTGELEWRPAASAYTALLEISTVEVA